MKTLISLLLILFLGFSTQSQIIIENFDWYPANSYTAQYSPYIETWSNQSAGPEDAFLSSSEFYSFPNSMHVTGNNPQGGADDLALLIWGSEIDQSSCVQFKMFIDENSGGYFNMQGNCLLGAIYAYEVMFTSFQIEVRLEDQLVSSMPYNRGEWLDIYQSISYEENVASIYINGELLAVVDYPHASIGAVNFYSYGGNGSLLANYYVDDILVHYNSFECGSVTSVEENLYLSPKVYPNPTIDYVNIEGLDLNSNLRVLDALGREIHSELVISRSLQIDLSTFENGVYVVESWLNGTKHTNKILKN